MNKVARVDGIDVLGGFINPTLKETCQRDFGCFLVNRGIREHIYYDFSFEYCQYAKLQSKTTHISSPDANR